MNSCFDLDVLTYADGRVLFSAIGTTGPRGHDIPHPIGDPDEDEELPDDGDDDDDDEEDEEDEEPLQV